MKSGKCPKCGSSDLSPRTWTKMAFVKKIICQGSRHVELGADNPEHTAKTRAGVLCGLRDYGRVGRRALDSGLATRRLKLMRSVPVLPRRIDRWS